MRDSGESKVFRANFAGSKVKAKENKFPESGIRIMKLEEYLNTLPNNVLSGEDVELSEKTLREIFKFVNLNSNDIFYHLGCGNQTGVELAKKEFQVKKSIGIDNNKTKIEIGNQILEEKKINAKLLLQNIEETDISDASVILFWFTDEEVISKMMNKFNKLQEGTKIITVWGPLPNCIPDKVSFPYIQNQIPLKEAKNMQEQVLAVFGVKCVDFVTAWEFAERYTKSIGNPEIKNDRFLTIIQTLVIWINAKKLGVACGEEIPESIRTYIGIMKMNFDIDFEYLLDE